MRAFQSVGSRPPDNPSLKCLPFFYKSCQSRPWSHFSIVCSKSIARQGIGGNGFGPFGRSSYSIEAEKGEDLLSNL